MKFDIPVNTWVAFGSEHAAAMLKGKEKTVCFMEPQSNPFKACSYGYRKHLAYLPLVSKERHS